MTGARYGRLAAALHRRRHHAHGDHRGVTLLEILVAVFVLGLLAVGIGAATISSNKAAAGANVIARRNALLTAFGESLKNLPYQKCATNGDYQSKFDTTEGALSDANQDLRQALNATLTVTGATVSATCPGLDTGTQTLDIAVTVSGETLTGQIVKRNPESEQIPVTVDFERSVQSVAGGPSALWAFTANGTVSAAGIFKYEWWCNATWADGAAPVGTPDFTTYSSTDPTVSCRYLAPAAAGVTQAAALRVTDTAGATWPAGGSKVKSWPLDPAIVPHNNPTAQITVTPACDATTPCRKNVPISFESTGPEPPDASIVQWQWNFGDGSAPILCGSPTCKDQVHSYQGGIAGAFNVTLKVTDSLGGTGTASTAVVVEDDPVVLPTVVLTASVTKGVSPQRVVFSAANSHADGYPAGGGISYYVWEYGYNGQGTSGASASGPAFTYPAAGKFTAKVTVTDVNGATNFATIVIDLGGLTGFDPLLPPIQLRNTGDHKGDLPFIRNARFDFQWTSVPRSPGDSITYKIRISAVGGFCSGLLGVGAAGKVFTVAGAPEGANQNYRAQFDSNPFDGFNGVCTTDSFTYSGQTTRTTAEGAYYESLWSSPQPLSADFF